MCIQTLIINYFWGYYINIGLPLFQDLQTTPKGSVIYKLTVEDCHYALFHVTYFTVKSLETYNLSIGPSRLRSITCDPILKPDRRISILGHFLECLSCVGKFTECPMLNHYSPSLPPSNFFLDMKLLRFNANISSCRNR
jgi:hypothetical protein